MIIYLSPSTENWMKSESSSDAGSSSAYSSDSDTSKQSPPKAISKGDGRLYLSILLFIHSYVYRIIEFEFEL